MNEKGKEVTGAALDLLRAVWNHLDFADDNTMRDAASRLNKVLADAEDDPSTPNGFDPNWIECINVVLEERDTAVRIKDITPDIWESFIGPMCDAIEVGDIRGDEIERGIYRATPDGYDDPTG